MAFLTFIVFPVNWADTHLVGLITINIVSSMSLARPRVDKLHRDTYMYLCLSLNLV